MDSHTFTVQFSDAFQLMEHLQVCFASVHASCRLFVRRHANLRCVGGQGMGESSALLRGKGASRELLLATAAAYQGMYGNPDGTVPATFQVCHRGVSACTCVCVCV